MNTLISSKEEAATAETMTEVVGSIESAEIVAEVEGTSEALVESVEAGATEVEAQVEEAIESIDAAVSESQPATN